MRFLVTAGPTREHLDPIRYISNCSSGKMGFALARAACRYGQVTLVSGPVALKPPGDVEFVPVTSAAEMAKAVLSRYGRVDVVIMAAAVCDFRPRRPSRGKIKKAAFAGRLELAPTVDILAELGRRKRRQVLVGFAAETGSLIANARAKLRHKNLNLIVANRASAMESDTNRATLLYADGRVEELPEMSKRRLAAMIVSRIASR